MTRQVYAFEDEDNLRELYKRIAGIATAQFKAFPDPSHLKGLPLEEIAARFADVAGIITDMEMPVVSGSELIKLLRDAGYKNPILMITSGLRSDEINQLRQDLSAAYPGTETSVESKPFEVKNIMNMMKRWIA